jgi:putative ABC transport system substrate-binding protein
MLLRLELLKEIAPSLSWVLVLAQAGNVANQARLRVIEEAAPSLGVQVSSAAIRSEANIESAIRAAAGQPNAGLIVLPAPPLGDHRQVIFDLAARHRLPAIYSFRQYVAEGGLMSYGEEPVPCGAKRRLMSTAYCAAKSHRTCRCKPRPDSS